MKKILIVLAILVVALVSIIFFTYQNFTAVTTGEKIARYENPRKAILVIDIQTGFTSSESDYGLNKDQQKQMIANTNRLLKSFKKKGITAIYIKQIFKDDFLVKLFTGGKMQKGSKKIEFDPKVKIIGENIFVKHVMDAFSNKKLDHFLIKNQVNHLYITGLDARACVDKTIKAALSRGYKVTVVKDAIASKSDELLQKKISQFKGLGAKISETKDLL